MAATDRLFAGVELGGTKCICLLASDPDTVLEEIRLPTGEPAGTLRAVAAILSGWQRHHSISSLGVAAFGPIERDPRSSRFGRVLTTPKPGWSGVDLLASFRHLGLPIAFDTDVNGAALAEARWGAARELHDFAYITVGTGIGVGTVVDGRPLGRHAHSEAGHLRIGRLPGDDWPGACPFHGDCVEGLASGAAIAARTGHPAASLPDDDAVWEPVGHAIATLCHNLALSVVPQRILLGGGIALGRPALLSRVRRTFAAGLAGYATEVVANGDIDTYLMPPALGRRAGPLGAIALAQRALERC